MLSIASAVGTGMRQLPRSLTVLSVSQCPNNSWTARRVPVRRYISAACVGVARACRISLDQDQCWPPNLEAVRAYSRI